ncbi:hypothetical protein ONR75_18435 [Rhodopseudomonas sp. P2A-2r]|uniref:hypothetical protein n=1 Tax=Rhodopseudomonas sp. P2A-2r TaxID=2991972 RepID=UPI0022342AF4|nr:hypothetical protein [Rhodopseudomonas sp. P2A-2r]UZE46984.1 hypothetical protein ONR75_18435 [Rhodopseudomonas sp. P2A-2r]
MKKGEDVVLRRSISGVSKAVTVRAHVRNFHLSASDIVTGISKVPFIVILSLTQIRAAGWPQGAPAPAAPPFNVDSAIPVVGDTLVIKGAVRTVKAVDPRAVNGIVVRVHMIVEG